MNSDKKPTINPTPDGPYMVEGLEGLNSRKGAVEAKPKMFLCRCGGSANKPFCDGTHKKNGFMSKKLEGRTADKREDYAGAKITVHDNRGICAHAGRCTDGLKSAFKLGEEPWIDPNGATAEEIANTINTCPSGALSYTINAKEHRDRDGEPSIFIAPNGPYIVLGGPELVNTERAEGASKEHFTLCRCGGSKNKPFCDGTHWYNKFTDEKN